MGLAGCGLLNSALATRPDGIAGWRFASGEAPTRAEYAAVVAACQDDAVRTAQGRPLDACLADLGLRRSP